MTQTLALATGELANGLIREFPLEAAIELEKAPDAHAIALLTDLSAESAARLVEHLTPVSVQRLLQQVPPTVAASRKALK